MSLCTRSAAGRFDVVALKVTTKRARALEQITEYEHANAQQNKNHKDNDYNAIISNMLTREQQQQQQQQQQSQRNKGTHVNSFKHIFIC